MKKQQTPEERILNGLNDLILKIEKKRPALLYGVPLYQIKEYLKVSLKSYRKEVIEEVEITTVEDFLKAQTIQADEIEPEIIEDIPQETII